MQNNQHFIISTLALFVAYESPGQRLRCPWSMYLLTSAIVQALINTNSLLCGSRGQATEIRKNG